jgi:hypothetical protein
MLKALQRFLLEKSVSEINAVCPGGLINHYKTKRYGGFPKVGKRRSNFRPPLGGPNQRSAER